MVTVVTTLLYGVVIIIFKNNKRIGGGVFFLSLGKLEVQQFLFLASLVCSFNDLVDG